MNELNDLYNNPAFNKALLKIVKGDQNKFYELKHETILLLLNKPADYIQERIEKNYLLECAITVAQTLVKSKRQDFHKNTKTNLELTFDLQDFQIDKSLLDVLPDAINRLDVFEQFVIKSLMENGGSIKKTSDKTGYNYQYIQKIAKRAKVKLYTFIEEESKKVDEILEPDKSFQKIRMREGVSVLDEVEMI